MADKDDRDTSLSGRTSAGPGRGTSKGGPSLGKSTSTPSKSYAGGGGTSSPSYSGAQKSGGKNTPSKSSGGGGNYQAARADTPSSSRPSVSKTPGKTFDANRFGERYGVPTVGAGRGVSKGGPSLAPTTPRSTFPDLHTRTRMSSVPTASTFPDLRSRTRMGSVDIPTAPKGLGTPVTVDNVARAKLASQVRMAENLSMDTYNAAAKTSALNAARADVAQQARAAENLSMGDYDALKESYRVAIAGRETEGIENPYAAKHADVKRRDGSITNAYGKYGVMEDNIGPWTKEVFGRPMSVEEFRNNPAVQDAVFDAKIGSYVAKYGSFEKAAQAWYGGPGAVGKRAQGPRAGNPGPNVGVYSDDAMGRQENAYADLKAGVRAGQPAQTQVAEAPQPSRTVTDAQRTAAANEARRGVEDAAREQGIDPKSPTVQASADLAAKEAVRSLEEGTAAEEPAPAPASVPAPAPVPVPTPAPARPTRTPGIEFPNQAPKPTPRDAKPYERTFKQQAAAGVIDVLMGSNPVTLGLNLASFIGLGTSVGGAVVDAMGGKYGENYYNPGDMPERKGGAVTDRLEDRQTASTARPKTAREEAATFEEKYLTFNDPTWRPTPEQKWGVNPAYPEYV